MIPAFPPGLESRFLPPQSWRTDSFTSPAGRKIHFGFVLPPDPAAIVVGLQGLGEFTEKYYETAHGLLKRNLGFFMMDWPGQGRSQRFLKNQHSRHQISFDEDVAALQVFVTEHVRPAAGGRKLVMLGHSMGAHIGLRHLLRHPDNFACAAFTAPMTGMLAVNAFPLARFLLPVLNMTIGNRQTGFNGRWRPYDHNDPRKNIYSRDSVRGAVYNAWCAHDPALRIGNVTYGWVHEAYKSCLVLSGPHVARDIVTPCLFALAGHERLVDNDATRRLAAAMPQAKVIELEDSWHEILMERDDIRARFFYAFDELLTVNGITFG